MKALIEIPRHFKQLIAIASDAVILPLIFMASILLRHGNLASETFTLYQWLVLASPVVFIPIFLRLGLYRAVIRFINQTFIYTTVLGVTLSIFVIAAIATFLHNPALSRSVFGIYWTLGIFYILSSRFLIQNFLTEKNTHKKIPIVVYGAGIAGQELITALRTDHRYKIVALIDDKKDLQGASIAGVRVYPPSTLPSLARKQKIEELLLAMPSLNRTQKQKILDRLEPLKIKTRFVNTTPGLVEGDVYAQHTRDIDLEDLLSRESVLPHPNLIANFITGKTVLITGAGGSIGAELCRQIIQFSPKNILLLEISEYSLYAIEQDLIATKNKLEISTKIVPFLGSVLQKDRCEAMLRTFKVNTVYHAAAYKHVPLVEQNPIQGIHNNVFGTLEIAQAAIAAGVSHFVLISTDKAVRPTNVMGATKRLAELILQAFSKKQSKTRFCMVRFGNVLGSSGSVVPLFRKQILAGGPVTLTHPEVTRYFMTIPEAAQLVLQAGAMSHGGDVFVLNMGKPVKIKDLAIKMIHFSGFTVHGEGTEDTEQRNTIEIIHIGLRPGEKLYEELLIGDDAEGTAHPLIMRAREKEMPWDTLKVLLHALETACNTFDYPRVRTLLMEIVEEYTPNNSSADFIWLEKNKENSNKMVA